MTDIGAIDEAQGKLLLCGARITGKAEVTVSFLDHALRAIEDRASLLGALEAAAVEGSVQVIADAARRHTRGLP